MPEKPQTLPFKHHRILRVRLTESETWTPPHVGHHYRVLSGYIHHKLGFTTLLVIYDGKITALVTLAQIASTVSTASFMLNDKILTNFVHLVNSTEIWFSHRETLRLSTGTGGYIDLLIEERW